jgi:uncharacterized protein YndB with AHSA1/START domain
MSANSEAAASQSKGMEIVSTRTFADSPEVVFDAFSDPDQLAQWWGPKGFTNTIDEFDFRPGGAWRFVMHGPDGTRYPNVSEFVEMVRPERIIFVHLRPVHQFRMTMRFENVRGQTKLTWLMEFEPDDQNEKLRPYIVEANEQNLDRLAAHLLTLRKDRDDNSVEPRIDTNEHE